LTVLVCDVVWEDHRQRRREDILWAIGFGAAEADFVSEHCKLVGGGVLDGVFTKSVFMPALTARGTPHHAENR
jgi:hypothetical protein